MRVLLVGGAGLVGSRLETMLFEDKHETLVLDSFTSNNEPHRSFKGQVVTANACSFPNVNRVFSFFKPDVVFHFADSLYDKEGVYDFQQEAEVCISVANNINRCVGLYGVKNVFFGSSGEVYKKGSNKPISERAHTGSVSYTGATNKYVEDVFSLASSQNGFNFTSIRFFQVTGDRNTLNPKHDVLTFFVDSVIKEEGVVIVGPKTYIDILSVTDAVLASYIIFNTVIEGASISKINVGSGKGVCLGDLYMKVYKKLKEGKPHVYTFPPKKQTRSLIANNALLESLGWNMSLCFEDYLDGLIEFREKIINAK